MNRPRIFLGSSGKQASLLQEIADGLEEVDEVEPWTTTFGAHIASGAWLRQAISA